MATGDRQTSVRDFPQVGPSRKKRLLGAASVTDAVQGTKWFESPVASAAGSPCRRSSDAFVQVCISCEVTTDAPSQVHLLNGQGPKAAQAALDPGTALLSYSVADETTAILMERFYGYLKAGKSKDAALREAQMDLIRGSHPRLTRPRRAGGADVSHPYDWAAFQLTGDWR
jgi:hypothetical protein